MYYVVKLFKIVAMKHFANYVLTVKKKKKNLIGVVAIVVNMIYMIIKKMKNFYVYVIRLEESLYGGNNL